MKFAAVIAAAFVGAASAQYSQLGYGYSQYQPVGYSQVQQPLGYSQVQQPLGYSQYQPVSYSQFQQPLSYSQFQPTGGNFYGYGYGAPIQQDTFTTNADGSITVTHADGTTTEIPAPQYYGPLGGNYGIGVGYDAYNFATAGTGMYGGPTGYDYQGYTQPWMVPPAGATIYQSNTPPAVPTTPTTGAYGGLYGGLYGQTAFGGLYGQTAFGGLYGQTASYGGLYGQTASYGGLNAQTASYGGLYGQTASYGGLYGQVASYGGLFGGYTTPAATTTATATPTVGTYNYGGLFGQTGFGGFSQPTGYGYPQTWF